MKPLLIGLGLLLLVGCGKDDLRPVRPRGGYPALNESPPPPLLPQSRFSNAPEVAPVSKAPAAEMVDDGLVSQARRKEEQLQSLRNYAAQAGTNDPFALTEKEIEELSKMDELVIY